MKRTEHSLAWLLAIFFAFSFATEHGFAQKKRSSQSRVKPIKVRSIRDIPKEVSRKKTRRRVKVKSEALRRAVEAYRLGQYQSSLMTIDDLLRRNVLQPSDRRIAKFFLGKTLFKLEFFYSAAEVFFDLLKDGPNSPYYFFSFQRVFWVAVRDNNYELLADAISQSKRQVIPSNYKDTVYFMLARQRFDAGKLGAAEQYAAKVSRGSAFYQEAAFLRGMAALALKRKTKALGFFREATDGSSDKIKALAFMAMGRIHFADRQYSKALAAYGRVPEDTNQWIDSLVEISWIHFNLKQDSLALGSSHAFDKEVLDKYFSPEAPIVRATIFYRLCKYDDAERAVQVFFDKYHSAHRKLEAFNAKYKPGTAAQARAILNVISGRSKEMDRLIVKRIFGEKWFTRRIDMTASLRREERRFRRVASFTRTKTGTRLLGKVKTRRRAIEGQVLREAQRRLSQWEKRLAGFFRQASIVRFESVYAAIDHIPLRQRVEFEIPKNPEYEIWRFDKEYWEDELGDYRYLLRSECEEQL